MTEPAELIERGKNMRDPAIRMNIQETKMEAVETTQKAFMARFDRIEFRLDRIEDKITELHRDNAVVHEKISDVRSSLEGRISDVRSSLEDKITNVHAAITKQTRWILVSFGTFVTALLGGLAAFLYKILPVLDSLARALNRI